MSSQQLNNGKTCTISTFPWYAIRSLKYTTLHVSLSLTPRQIHVSKAGSPEEDPKLAPKALKLMHRFTQEQVKSMMDKAEGGLTKP